MADQRNELLLAALRRAGKPMASDELLDVAIGLATAEGWTPEQSAMTRKSIAARLVNMVLSGEVKQDGVVIDKRSRRPTPQYAPVDGYDLRADVPAPPPARATTARNESSFAELNRTQMLALLDAQDELLATFARRLQDQMRHLQDQQQFFERLSTVRERVRGRLLAVGLGGD